MRRRRSHTAGNPLGVDLYCEDWYAVYLHRAEDGRVLYVGCSKNLLSRTEQHRYQSAWGPEIASVEIDSIWPSQTAGFAREKELIQSHRPAGNRQHNTARGAA